MSSEQLIDEASKLSLPDLERFVAQVIALQAQRKAPSVSAPESELLQRINQGIPPDLKHRYQDLIAKRRAENLNPIEREELLRLTHVVETSEYQRVQDLTELARIRGTTLSELMRTLGLDTAGHA